MTDSGAHGLTGVLDVFLEEKKTDKEIAFKPSIVTVKLTVVAKMKWTQNLSGKMTWYNLRTGGRTDIAHLSRATNKIFLLTSPKSVFATLCTKLK